MVLVQRVLGFGVLGNLGLRYNGWLCKGYPMKAGFLRLSVQELPYSKGREHTWSSSLSFNNIDI